MTQLVIPDLFWKDVSGGPRWDKLHSDARYAGAILKVTQGRSGYAPAALDWFRYNWDLLWRMGSVWARIQNAAISHMAALVGTPPPQWTRNAWMMASWAEAGSVAPSHDSREAAGPTTRGCTVPARFSPAFPPS